ncbi:c-type cytochrome [Dyella flava]|uniref:Cytochrome c n=1 Tax=Dyella flava TaxID=1920170 RepID=A0ABS2K2Z7_9GAMM|nr:c-type cytochrome [Dyella flava]MBM7125127.1 cytochrome c [Dyella flava]GLQ52001.1 alcohol dehydrogenase [Dyella flava]
MKRLLVIVIIVVLLGVGAYVYLNRADTSDGTAPALAGAPASAEVLARGEYLTKAADCTACHTVPGSHKPFAGGVAFKLPFGTIYSSNITADEANGIGSWSDDDFVRALRQGVRKDGQHLYPAFPYTSYTQLSRSDALAIKAYLFSLPKISQPNKTNDLSFPYNQRWAMGFWNAAFFKSERFQPDPAQSPQWNSGKYVAIALEHCGECHTPRNLGFGLEHGNALAGEELQGWRAYNITSDKVHGIGAWSDSDLISYLATGHADGRGTAAGPMAEAVENSLRFLNPSDTAALVTYLRSVPARAGKDPITIDAQAAPALASNNAAPGGDSVDTNHAGLKLFEGACASCHQWNGKGQQTPYASLLGTRGVNDVRGTNVTQILLHGSNLHAEGPSIFMPEFGDAYSNTEIAALANYVIAHFGNKQGTVTPDDVAARRKQF